MTLDQALALAVALSRWHIDYRDEAQPGDLVVEATFLRRNPDPDAIGWLVGHGLAPYNEDGTGEVREVWDITPLSGMLQPGRPYQRWENAHFVPIPERIWKACRLERPEGWYSDFASQNNDERKGNDGYRRPLARGA